MPKLELLRIRRWGALQELSGLKNLANLKEIRLKGFDKQFKDNVEKQLQVPVAGNPNNNVRILLDD